MAVKAPRVLYNLALKQVSFKQRTPQKMATKDWTTNVGLATFPNSPRKPMLLMTEDISLLVGKKIKINYNFFKYFYFPQSSS